MKPTLIAWAARCACMQIARDWRLSQAQANRLMRLP